MRWTLMLLLVLGALAGGCTVKVASKGALRDPVSVHLIDYGRTSALIIPDRRGDGWVKYAYGDWDWYALRKTAWWRSLPALLWPTRGALGRAELSEPKDEWAVETHVLQVERRAAARLQRKLDEMFWRERKTLIATPEVGLEFVHHGRSYWWAHNSNHATARWLREMDVDVSGWPVWSKWEVQPASGRD